MKYEQLAKDIIEKVGGKENVNNVVHCITRLRFKLKDEDKAQTEALKNMDGIVTVMKSGGQYQVVIGNHVPDVYKAVVEVGGFANIGQVDDDEQEKRGNLFNRFIDIIASIFTPILGVLAATGMIKGFNALFLAVGWLEETDGTYQLLNIVGDSLFHFFPIFLGYTAIKKFGGTPFIGIAIGASLVYPAVESLMEGEPLYVLFAGTVFESPVYITFLGIPVILMSYATSVVPIILAAFFASKVERFFRKVIPDVVKTFLVPFFTLLVVVPLTFMIIGPIATWASQLLGQGTIFVYELSPTIAGLVLGAFWQVIVIFGLHWGLVPIAINNLVSTGSDPILAMIFAASFAQIGAVLAVWIRTKNQKLKSLSIPAFISGIFGVTEPAIYGITLPKKKPFIFSLVGAGIGGAIIGFFGGAGYMIGGLGIFQIPAFIGPEGIDTGFWGAIISMPVAFGIGFILTYLFAGIHKEETPVERGANTESASPDATVEKTVAKEVEAETLASPLKGKAIPLERIKDEAFASAALGKGIAILPTEGKVFAPADGTITALFPTNHAIGMTTDKGAELLIHVGMDTVQLQGQYFSSHVKQGERVEKGQLLMEFDIDKIQQAGFMLDTPIVVTNHEHYTVITTEETNVQVGDHFLTLEKK
ncbi:PTS system, beta-glucoside-specific enzyme II, ABC component [Niallia circulans]|uniref:beta-glucoside-specific PTS transporter subunit IIABC n=1 Tax=Shouchella clausii TaxID=79880 RepID=UPI000B95CB48|nr:beta-glucoside-specific PTS transporter subunit IIABC [Shouchella clausii]SPT80741.1 PTS system, beta-glucoside-specific enzyme II, ABC component [Niallia circulans]AST96822.1 PTS beta-glucoside transporter subunit IIABC [Shouchella clausii]MCR1287235.1 beta-glucoside-specific PTS transporter subunit IIABC [Shouchella clausii]MEB5471619.1 beta-glucoside-specific PTS transporter subunit IIABC [Shouchella clausii]PAF12930.1 PTS beta-glucoside transporter subunit IIABC [Shouchella clausii]